MGYQKTKNGTACVACTATGCSTCSATGVAVCDGCRAGFRDTDTVSTTWTCAACSANCATCTTTSAAEVCTLGSDGYYVNGSNAVTKCPDNAT